MNGSPPEPVPVVVSGADMNGSPPVPVPVVVSGAAMNGSPPVPVPVVVSGAAMNGSPDVAVSVPRAVMTGSPDVSVSVPGAAMPSADMPRAAMNVPPTQPPVMNRPPDPGPDCCEIILTKEWAMLMEILFLMDKLHDCAETRVKRMGFGEYVKEIHHSLIERIKRKLIRLLTLIQPGFDPTKPFTGPNPVPDPVQEGTKDKQFIFRFCVIVFDFFRTQFKSAKYEATILNILIRALKILECDADIASETRMSKVIHELDCAVVNNAVMGTLQTSHPYTYEGEAQPTNTVTICTPGGTLTDGGTVFDKRPVYIKPRNMRLSYLEGRDIVPYIQLNYRDYSDTTDGMLRGMNDDQLIEHFQDFLTVSILDIENARPDWSEYRINPMRKVHNKVVLADELSKKYFSKETPRTDKKALCDFLQHFLPLAFVNCKVCFAVYQNDLMSVIFHMMTMIAIRESGETRTAMNCMKAVLYCPKRKLVFETVDQPGPAGGGGPADQAGQGSKYHLTCVIDCLDNKDDGEGENGDVDEMKDYETDVMEPMAGQMGGTVPNLSLKQVKSRTTHKAHKAHKAKRKRIRTRKRHHGGASAVLAAVVAADPVAVLAKDPYPNTRAWADYETFCYMMDHLQEPYTLYLSLMYRYHKQNGFTTLSITDYINGHIVDQTNPNNIEMEPYTFRDRAFLYYTFLDVWLDSGNEDFSSFKVSFAEIEKINQVIDGEFAFQSSLYNATIAMSRVYNPVIENTSPRSENTTKRMRVGTNATRKLSNENRGAENRGTEKKVPNSVPLTMKEIQKEIQKEIEEKKKVYESRKIDLHTEQERLAVIVKTAIAKHTQAIAKKAKKEVDTVIVLEDRLEDVEGGDDLKAEYKKSYDEYLKQANTEIDEVVRKANVMVRVRQKRNKQSVMDTMIKTYELQESSKKYAEQAWGNAMSRRYINQVLIAHKRIVDIQGVVVTDLELAIKLLDQLRPVNLAISLTGCEDYKKMIVRLTELVNQHVLQSVKDPPRAEENTKILMSLLTRATTLQSKAKNYVETLGVDIKRMEKRREERMKKRATSMPPVRQSEKRSRDRSRDRSRERSVPRGRSREGSGPHREIKLSPLRSFPLSFPLSIRPGQ